VGGREMMIQLRPYFEEEFEWSVQIRELGSDESVLNNWKNRLLNSGKWDDHYLHLAIEVDGNLAGDLQLRYCEKTMPPGNLEIGMEVGKKYRGQGIGTQAIKLASSRFLAEGFHRVSGSTESSNKAMIKVFQKAGWKHEGTLRGLFKEGENLLDYELYAITT
jgi:RimJ/RimL family protein N-acetyltransferase